MKCFNIRIKEEILHGNTRSKHVEGRKKGVFLKKAHGDGCSSSALIQNRERLSCETSGPTQSQNQSLGFSANTRPIPRATGKETALRACFCCLATFSCDYLYSQVSSRCLCSFTLFVLSEKLKSLILINATMMRG